MYCFQASGMDTPSSTDTGYAPSGAAPPPPAHCQMPSQISPASGQFDYMAMPPQTSASGIG